MSYAPSTFCECPPIQAELDAYFATCDASLLPDPAPLNEFLWSGLNRSGIQQQFTPSTNKLRTIILRYDQRLLESEVSEVDSCTRVCVAEKKRGDLCKEYTIDPCNKLRVSELIDANDFRASCLSNFDIVNKKMRLMMNALLAKVATKMTGLVVANFGAWSSDVPVINDGGDATLVLNTLNPSSTAFNPGAAYDLAFALQQTAYCNGAAVFAGGTFFKYAKMMESGCCSAEGLDLGDIISRFGKAVLWDRRVQAALGIDYALAVMPKALQPVYYVANNDGINVSLGLNVGTNYQKQVIFEPSTGLPIDLTLADDCGEVSIIMETVVDLKTLPIDMFAPGDYMEGVTFVNKIKVTNT